MTQYYQLLTIVLYRLHSHLVKGPRRFFPAPGSSPGRHAAFSHHVPLVPSNLGQFHGLCLLWSWHIWEYWPVICRMSLNLTLFNVSPRLDSSYAFLAEHHRNDVVSFSVPHYRRDIMSVWAQWRKLYLVKVVSARCLYCDVTLSLYWINKQFVGRYSRLHNNLFLLKFHS